MQNRSGICHAGSARPEGGREAPAREGRSGAARLRRRAGALISVFAFFFAANASPAPAADLDRVDKACLAGANSFSQLSANLVSAGLEQFETGIDAETAARHFAFSLIGENVPFDSRPIDWKARLRIDTALLQRTIDRGQTNSTQFAFFGTRPSPGLYTVYAQRRVTQGVKASNLCLFSAGVKKDHDREPIAKRIGALRHHNRHDDGYAGGILHYAPTSGFDLTYDSLSYFDSDLVARILDPEPTAPNPVLTALVEVTRPHQSPANE